MKYYKENFSKSMRACLFNFVKFIGIMVLICPYAARGGDRTTEDLIKQADYLQHRHEVLAQNVANVSTPKYIAQDIEKPAFHESNNRKVRVSKVRMAVTDPGHIRASKNRAGKHNIILDKTSPMKANKNNVDLTKQVTNIAQNNDEMSIALKNYRTSMDLINTAAGNGGQ